jgi:GT2 family glycosyltransferase
LPDLSVVIPVYDNWWLTARCLRELETLRSRTAVSFETIVVDNASSDETPEAIASFPAVRYLRHETNRNFAGACNAGAALAQAPLTLLLNNDAYPLGDALAPLVEIFARPEVAIAGGALFFEDGVTQAAGLVLLTNAHWHYFCRNLPATLDAVDRPRDALAVSGAAMAVRTQWFVESGGFDASFVNGFEDVDLCLRARAQDRAIVYVPNARFAHYEAASAGRFDREAENERRFYARWSANLAALPRTVRGETGAIAVRTSRDEGSLLAAARNDLEAALRDFGHPVIYGSVAAWRRLDRRFRRAATLEWFTGDCASPGIAIAAGGSGAAIRTQGGVTLEVPWLPCASLERLARLGVRRARDPSSRAVGVVGSDHDARAVEGCGYPAVRITTGMLLGKKSAEVACIAHFGLTDECAFGTVLLAQAGFPSVAIANDELRAIFAPDVALLCERDALFESLNQMLSDAEARDRYAALVAADARRRFSPRRSAIRIVDLLCAARFGLERPAFGPRRNTPL